MRGPALAQTTCPGCGAPIRVDVWSQVHKCRFCGQSSFVHRPNKPVLPPPPGQENFGHIHVNKAAVNKSVALVAVLVFVAVNLIVGPIAIIIVAIGALGAAAASKTPGPIPPSPNVTVVTPSQPSPVNVSSGALGPSCLKLIRCCKVIQPQSAGCEAMGMLGEVECAKQAKTFEDAARAMSRRCD